MPANPLTRAAILSLTGPALDEAMAENSPWPIWDGTGIAPTRPFLMREASGFTLFPGGGWVEWRPHDSLDAVRLLELALNREQRILYCDGICKLAEEFTYFAMLTASPTTRCHALLLAVVAPEE